MRCEEQREVVEDEPPLILESESQRESEVQARSDKSDEPDPFVRENVKEG